MIISTQTFTKENIGEYSINTKTLDYQLFYLIFNSINIQNTILTNISTGEQIYIEKMSKKEHDTLINMSTKQALNFLNNTCCDGVLFKIIRNKNKSRLILNINICSSTTTNSKN